MAFTTAQIYNLNNSMSAAQDVSLGTLLNAYASNKVVSGSFTSSSAITTITTGLTTVTNAVCSLSGSPTNLHMWSTVTNGSVAGTIIISNWQPTNASTVTPVISTGSASAHFAAVKWIAVGT